MAIGESTFQLHVLIYKDQEEGFFIARCLEFDLVHTSKYINEVEEAIESIIKTHLEFAFEKGYTENLFNPSPKEFWDMFYQTEFKKIKKIQFSLRNIIPKVEIQRICYA